MEDFSRILLAEESEEMKKLERKNPNDLCLGLVRLLCHERPEVRGRAAVQLDNYLAASGSYRLWLRLSKEERGQVKHILLKSLVEEECDTFSEVICSLISEIALEEVVLDSEWQSLSEFIFQCVTSCSSRNQSRGLLLFSSLCSCLGNELPKLITPNWDSIQRAILEALSSPDTIDHVRKLAEAAALRLGKILIEEEAFYLAYRAATEKILSQFNKSGGDIEDLIRFVGTEPFKFGRLVISLVHGILEEGQLFVGDKKVERSALFVLSSVKSLWAEAQQLPPHLVEKLFYPIRAIVSCIEGTEESLKDICYKVVIQVFEEIVKDANLTSVKRKPSSDSSSIKPPDDFDIQISRYETEFEELDPKAGKGGQGIVMICRNKLDNMKYAIKKIQYHDSNEKKKEEISREVRTLACMQHPNIVRYYQAWKELCDDTKLDNSSASSEDIEFSSGSDGKSFCVYIQMEYCSSTLSEQLSKGEVDEETAWHYFRQVVEGLFHIHEKKIVHKDLSTQNILEHKKKLKIADFGLAMFLDEHGVIPDAEVVGNPLYRAPEIEDKNYQVTCKADIYSLGILCFELLYRCNSEMERRKCIFDVRKRKFPDTWECIHIPFMLELLSKNPAHRPSAKEILLLPLPW